MSNLPPPRAWYHDGIVEITTCYPISGQPPLRPDAPQPRGSRGPSFSWVEWNNKRYTFVGQKQRAVVAALWRAREEGEDCVLAEVLLTLADSDGGKVRDLFRRHPAWGELIVPGHLCGGPPGSYRLADGEK